MSTRDMVSFLRAWTSNPRRVGAITPSGPALTELMTSQITPTSGPVIELGAGTGVFTNALISRGIPEAELTLIDSGSEFANLLQARYPKARVLCMDAEELGQRALYETASVGAVISGLPLLNMPAVTMMAILRGAFAYIRPRGAFYQFTYGLRCPVPKPLLDRLGLRATCIGRALVNVPPAAVYRITRRDHPPSQG